MWFQIFKFELQYRKKRPATYIYFGILFLMAFLTISTDIITIGGGTGLVKENAPATIAKMMIILTAVMMMITSAIMGVGVLRDFEHNTESMLFTTPIKKRDYLLGRFLGSFLVTLLVFSGILIGFILGEFMPWREADKLLPFNFWNYFHPFLYFVIPNLFFSGVLFFITGALSRKMVVVYVQWIVLFVFYQIGATMMQELDNQELAAILDPFAYNTINNATQYWTVAEQNSLVVPIEGSVLINRIIWTLFGFVLMVGGYFTFSFNVVKNSWIRKKTIKNKEESKTDMLVPQVNYTFGIRTYLLQIWTQTWFYCRFVFKGIPFKAIIGFAFILMVINSFYIGEVFGTYTYPTTYLMMDLLDGSFRLFLIIIVVFYSGELIWSERDVRINLIQDALPMPDFVNLISKFLGLTIVFVIMLFLMILSGVTIQTFKAFYDYRLDVYFGTFYTQILSFLVLYTLLAFFIQVMVNNKFLGHAVMIVFFITMIVLDNLGLEHSLFQFGSAVLGDFSEMNGYGHFFTGFNWFDLYWMAFTIFLFAVSVMFAVRGSEAAMKWRWKVGQLRLTKPILTFGITAFLTFGLSGCYIYYNTNMVNSYQNSDEQEKESAEYEKTLKKYEWALQPKVTDVNLQVELYPSERDYTVEGNYILKNFETNPISDIHLQLTSDADMDHEYIKFDRDSKVSESHDDFKFYIYTLEEPLQPGDSMKMSFRLNYVTKGFKESVGASNTGIVYNGTFLNNGQFPSLGYSEGNELSSDNDRKDHDLKPKNRSMSREDPRGLKSNFISDDSHGINFEIVIGTESDQIAIAPGYIQREWEEKGRKYYHYKMDQPMMPFFNIVSARYEVMRDRTTIKNDTLEKDINLEIYYHKGHEYNLESMMKGMKESFEYFSNNFSPYQFQQMRILEFPRYATFAQSFANTVPFSEGIGFMLKIEDEDDVDIAYYVTAHELAHQWWGHQLFPANVQGAAALSESLSQYSALMVMKQAYPEQHIREFLKQELDRYLSGRATETKREMPLSLVESQAYIHYGKGANVMYALQDYIGEDSVNMALQRLVRDFRTFEQNGRYATTKDLIKNLREVTPDSMQYIITDMFDKIILFENKVESATYTPKGDKYLVTIDLETKKLEADTIGVENPVTLTDWIDVGVYSKDEDGEDKLIYLKKHLFNKAESKIEIEVDEEPIKVGIDPLHKLIDRNPEDNIKPVSESEVS